MGEQATEPSEEPDTVTIAIPRRRTLAARYELREVIGAGGMGVVHLAWDPVLQRETAVKLLLEAQGRDPVLVERFEREARAAAALSHPNIVAIHDSGCDGELRYIVMERIRGRDLARLLRDDGPPGLRRTLLIGTSVAAALSAAHSRGTVHRDVKPANVMLDEEGVVKVLDFGIARATTSLSVTQTGSVMGSVLYMAPEVARGDVAGPAADIYALGCILYELLAGRPPFAAAMVPEALRRHAEQAPHSLQTLGLGVSKDLDLLVMSMLGKSPDARPRSAADVRDELLQILAGEPGGSSHANTAASLALLDEAVAQRGGEPSSTKRFVDRRRTAILSSAHLPSRRRGPVRRPAAAWGRTARGRADRIVAVAALALAFAIVGLAVALGSAGGGGPEAGADSQALRQAGMAERNRRLAGAVARVSTAIVGLGLTSADPRLVASKHALEGKPDRRMAHVGPPGPRGAPPRAPAGAPAQASAPAVADAVAGDRQAQGAESPPPVKERAPAGDGRPPHGGVPAGDESSSPGRGNVPPGHGGMPPGRARGHDGHFDGGPGDGRGPGRGAGEGS